MPFACSTPFCSTPFCSDSRQVSEVERLAAGLWMLFNLGVTAYIVGVVASLATKSDEETAAYRGEVAELNGYAKRHGLPEALINTMHRALKLQYGSAASGAQACAESLGCLLDLDE